MDRTERRILDILKRGGGQRLTPSQIAERLGTSRERKVVVKRLAHLMSRGKVLKDSDGKFCVTSVKRRLLGRFEPTNERFGFVIPLSPGANDIYVPSQRWAGAIDGDIVEVAYTKKQRGRTSGQIVRIVERRRRELAGKVIKSSKGMFLEPLSAKIFHEVIVVGNEAGRVDDGIVANASIDRIDERFKQIHVTITEVWGRPDAPDVLCKIIVAKFDIPTAFSDEALAEAPKAVDGRFAVPRILGEAE